MFFLEDNVIGLRGLELEDLDIDGGYKDWFNDAVVCKYNSHHRYPVGYDSLRSFIKKSEDDSTILVFAVILKETYKHIGNISLQQIDLINRQAEIAFVFGEKTSWGKGYATRSAKLIIEHAFMELGMNRLFFGTSEENIGMQRIGEKLGFVRGGVARQAIFKDGFFHDVYQYDLLREEWRTPKREEFQMTREEMLDENEIL